MTSMPSVTFEGSFWTASDDAPGISAGVNAGESGFSLRFLRAVTFVVDFCFVLEELALNSGGAGAAGAEAEAGGGAARVEAPAVDVASGGTVDDVDVGVGVVRVELTY